METLQNGTLNFDVTDRDNVKRCRNDGLYTYRNFCICSCCNALEKNLRWNLERNWDVMTVVTTKTVVKKLEQARMW